MRDQIAHTIMVYSWERVGEEAIVEELQSPVAAYPLVDEILQHTDQISWCLQHSRSLVDPRATACLSGARDPCQIEIRYLLRHGPPPPIQISDENVSRVQDSIQAQTGVRFDINTIRTALQQLKR